MLECILKYTIQYLLLGFRGFITITVSPKIIEVENGCIWKIGTRVPCFTSMIMAMTSWGLPKKKSWELRWVNDLFIFMRSNFKLKDRMRLELELSTTLALQPERLWQWQLPSRGPGRGSGRGDGRSHCHRGLDHLQQLWKDIWCKLLSWSLTSVTFSDLAKGCCGSQFYQGEAHSNKQIVGNFGGGLVRWWCAWCWCSAVQVQCSVPTDFPAFRQDPR